MHRTHSAVVPCQFRRILIASLLLVGAGLWGMLHWGCSPAPAKVATTGVYHDGPIVKVNTLNGVYIAQDVVQDRLGATFYAPTTGERIKVASPYSIMEVR